MSLDYIFQIFAFDTIRSIVFILLGGFVASAIFRKIIIIAVTSVDDDDDTTNTLLEKRSRTLGSIANNIVNIVVWFTVFMMILSELGFDIGPVLAAAGVLGLSIGFGAQTLVKDMVTGFFILFENQYNLGDEIEIAGLKGKVAKMNIRTTIIKEKNGTKHIIPNSKITIVTKVK